MVRLLADQRYSDYLKIPVTGELGNIEIQAGKLPMKALIEKGLELKPSLLHIQAFSAFEPNPITGAFSAEIRAGLEITKTGVKPIKGGSISGVLTDNLKNCYLSSELTQRERILCPNAILFDQLTIAGA